MSRPAGIVAIQLGMGFQGIGSHEAAALLQSAFVLSNSETEEIEWLLKESLTIDALLEIPKAKFKRMVAHGWFNDLCDIWLDTLDPNWVDRVYRRIADAIGEGCQPEPFVTGDELIKLGATPGRQFKKWLEELYDRQLELEFSTREDALAAAKKLIAQG
jgi:hypothetical protein